MKSQELVDQSWITKTHHFDIRIVEATLVSSWGTEDLDSSWSLAKLNETRVYQRQALTLKGVVETFIAAKGYRVPTAKVEGTHLSLELQTGDLKRGRDGFFDYGCFGLAESEGKVEGATSFLRVSELQFGQLWNDLPVYLKALASHGCEWTLTARTVADERWPEAIPNGNIWRFWCTHVQFWLTAKMSTNKAV